MSCDVVDFNLLQILPQLLTAEAQCQCGRDKAPGHLAKCRDDLDSIILRRDDQKRRLPLVTLLTTKEGHEAFGRWCKLTGGSP